ncbi:MAG: TolC family protein [candidate division Zixibacteria bacterium]|nr:TolC family protein [candidate division Zixibacteria bacterium]
MKRVATLLAIVLTLGLLSSLVEAKELTLDDCINLALQNRATIIRARGAESQAGAAQRSALGAFLPNVRAGYSYSKGKQTDINPPDVRATEYVTVLDTTVIGDEMAVDAISVPVAFQTTTEQDEGPSKSWSIGASLDVLNVANWFDYAAANAAKASAELDVLASEQDLITAVKVSYYAYLAAVENVAVQQNAVKRADEQLKLIQSRFELGSASKSDVLRQKVQFGNDQLAFLRANNAVTQSKADLAYTVGIDPREDNQFSSDYRVREYVGTLDDAIGFSMEHNPRFLSTEKTVDQAKNSLRAAQSGYLPTLSASANWQKFKGTQAYQWGTYDFSNKSYSIGFSVSYNIFDGFLREQRVTGAKVMRNNAQADLADTRNSTIATVKSSYLEIDLLKKQVDVSTENVAAAEEDFRITQEKYNLGAATILDLLTSQVSLKEAQVALIRVQFDLNLAIARLENAMGKM